MLYWLRKNQFAFELVIKLLIFIGGFYMKQFLLIMVVSIVLLFAFIIACESDTGAYACWGGSSDSCWEASKDSASDCEAQGRTLSEGTCADNGYTKDCGTYWVKSWVACW